MKIREIHFVNCSLTSVIKRLAGISVLVNSRVMYHRSKAGVNSGPYTPGHDYLEEQNTQLEDELRGKVHALKAISIDIGAEVREHNRLLKDIDDDFDSTSGLLGKSISKVLQLAKSSHRYYFLYLFFFCIFVFLVLWFII